MERDAGRDIVFRLKTQPSWAQLTCSGPAPLAFCPPKSLRPQSAREGRQSGRRGEEGAGAPRAQERGAPSPKWRLEQRPGQGTWSVQGEGSGCEPRGCPGPSGPSEGVFGGAGGRGAGRRGPGLWVTFPAPSSVCHRGCVPAHNIPSALPAGTQGWDKAGRGAKRPPQPLPSPRATTAPTPSLFRAKGQTENCN